MKNMMLFLLLTLVFAGLSAGCSMRFISRTAHGFEMNIRVVEMTEDADYTDEDQLVPVAGLCILILERVDEKRVSREQRGSENLVSIWARTNSKGYAPFFLKDGIYDAYCFLDVESWEGTGIPLGKKEVKVDSAEWSGPSIHVFPLHPSWKLLKEIQDLHEDSKEELEKLLQNLKSQGLM